jgi:hypothetical protein
MKEHFLSYEQALAFKDLGFDEPCFGYYSNSKEHMGEIWYEMPNGGQDYIPVGDVLAPLYQQAFRWFRDTKLSDACVCRYQSRDDGGIYFYYVINHDYGIEETRHFKEGFFSYEEAEDACIDKIIKLIKKK